MCLDNNFDFSKMLTSLLSFLSFVEIHVSISYSDSTQIQIALFTQIVVRNLKLETDGQ